MIWIRVEERQRFCGERREKIRTSGSHDPKHRDHRRRASSICDIVYSNTTQNLRDSEIYTTSRYARCLLCAKKIALLLDHKNRKFQLTKMKMDISDGRPAIQLNVLPAPAEPAKRRRAETRRRRLKPRPRRPKR